MMMTVKFKLQQIWLQTKKEDDEWETNDFLLVYRTWVRETDWQRASWEKSLGPKNERAY